MPIFGGDGAEAELGHRFETWLRKATPLVDAEVTDFSSATAATGWSNETYKASVIERPGEAARKLIVRLPPKAVSLFEEYDMSRQYGVMKSLEGIEGYPVAKCLWLEQDETYLDRPFYVMDYVDGMVPPDRPNYHLAGWVVDATPEERRTLWTSTIDTIARLADVDWRKRGLERYGWPDRNRSSIDQHLEHWERNYEWGAKFLPEEEVPIVQELRRWLRANMPKDEETTFVWGDSRFANVIYRDFRPVALLDWEMSAVGDPEIDIAHYLFCNRHIELLGHKGDASIPRLSGFLTDEESIEHYERVSGRKVRHFNYYWQFNAYRIYAVRQRIAGLSVEWKTMSLEDAMKLRTVPTLEAETARRLV